MSNMELLRIVAMSLVMVVHASFLAFGVPSKEACRQDAIGSFGVFFFESVSVVCVNLFVLLSGWFGIKLKLKKIAEMLFQVCFFAFLVLAALIVMNPEEYFHLKYFSTLLMLNESDYWFIKSYIGLCIFAPFLNAFIERSNEKGLRSILIVFYIFQTVYGWLSINGAGWLCGGYSAVPFMGLYLLARYMRLYGNRIVSLSGRFHISVYVGIMLFQAVLAWLVTYMGFPVAGRLFTYTNPLVIVQALSLMLFFNKLSFQSKFINWIAISCVAVYLLHANELVLRTYYGSTIKYIHDCYGMPVSLLAIPAFMIAVFLVAILLDKVRISIWSVTRNIKDWEIK